MYDWIFASIQYAAIVQLIVASIRQHMQHIFYIFFSI